jgi:hypothetical protein
MRLACWGETSAEMGRPLPCASDRFLLRLENGNEDVGGSDGWACDYSVYLSGLVDVVRRKHRHIQLRIVLTQPRLRSDGTLAQFGHIMEMNFYTVRTTLLPAHSWSDDHDWRIDDVFVGRMSYQEMDDESGEDAQAYDDDANSDANENDAFDLSDDDEDDDMGEDDSAPPRRSNPLRAGLSLRSYYQRSAERTQTIWWREYATVSLQ